MGTCSQQALAAPRQSNTTAQGRRRKGRGISLPVVSVRIAGPMKDTPCDECQDFSRGFFIQCAFLESPLVVGDARPLRDGRSQHRELLLQDQNARSVVNAPRSPKSSFYFVLLTRRYESLVLQSKRVLSGIALSQQASRPIHISSRSRNTHVSSS